MTCRWIADKWSEEGETSEEAPRPRVWGRYEMTVKWAMPSVNEEESDLPELASRISRSKVVKDSAG